MPRGTGGTDPMIELMIGDAKKPRPAPSSIMYTTSNGYGVDASVVENRNRDKLVRASPVVVKGRCPYLSESRPLNGPAARVAMSVGMIGGRLLRATCGGRAGSTGSLGAGRPRRPPRSGAGLRRPP